MTSAEFAPRRETWREEARVRSDPEVTVPRVYRCGTQAATYGSTDREHHFDDRVEDGVHLLLSIAAALHAEGHRAHLLRGDRVARGEVASDPAGGDVDFVDT